MQKRSLREGETEEKATEEKGDVTTLQGLRGFGLSYWASSKHSAPNEKQKPEIKTHMQIAVAVGHSERKEAVNKNIGQCHVQVV